MPRMHGRSISFMVTSAAIVGSWIGFASGASGHETTLHAFRGGSDGMFPYGSLIVDQSGNLYGTTLGGGRGSCTEGCGLVFEISTHGKEKVLYAFNGGNDGRGPDATLIADGAGSLYGTTTSGGDTSCGISVGCGTVFKLAPHGRESILYAFHGGNDGFEPFGNLVADEGGNLYGVTDWGGNFNGTDCKDNGCGTVFELEPDGTKLTLHTFQAGTDGWSPYGRIILDNAGNLYGATLGGGAGCDCGTVYKIAPDGTESILYAFRGDADGGGGVGVTMDSAGNLYGATVAGGYCDMQAGCGTIYELAPSGKKTILYNFQGGDDGWSPYDAPVLDSKGNLYGTTWAGGNSRHCKFGGCGTVFELTAKGSEKVLFAFGPGGRSPYAGLLIGRHNNLYGTATQGGRHNGGVVFELKK